MYMGEKEKTAYLMKKRVDDTTRAARNFYIEYRRKLTKGEIKKIRPSEEQRLKDAEAKCRRIRSEIVREIDPDNIEKKKKREKWEKEGLFNKKCIIRCRTFI